MNIVVGILVLIGGMAVLQWMIVLRGFQRFVRSGPIFDQGNHKLSEHIEPLSVIIPIKGADPASEQALKRLFQTDFPFPVECWIVMEDKEDAAYVMVSALLAASPAAFPVEIVFSGPSAGRMGKLHNMQAGLAKTRHDHIVFLDADVEVTPELLAEGSRSLKHEQTGIVSAVPFYQDPHKWGGHLLSFWTNDYYVPYLLGLRQYKSFPFVVGACFFIRREVVERIDRFKGLEHYISDDAALAGQMQKLGLDTVVLPLAFTMTDGKSLKDGMNHLERWFVMLRNYNMAVYAALPLWHISLISMLAFIAAWLTWDAAWIWTGALLFGLSVILKWIGSALVHRPFQITASTARFLKLLVYEWVLFPVVWTSALFQTTLVWKGRRYQLGEGGKIKDRSDLES